MGTKIIITLALLSTSVYAMDDVRSKFPDYTQQFDMYEQRAQELPPTPIVDRVELNEGTIERVTSSPIVVEPQKKMIITRDDIKIPKFYSILPETYREKLIKKRIKKEQDRVDAEWLKTMSPDNTAGQDRNL